MFSPEGATPPSGERDGFELRAKPHTFSLLDQNDVPNELPKTLLGVLVGILRQFSNLTAPSNGIPSAHI